MNSLIRKKKKKKKLFQSLNTAHRDDHSAFEMPFICKPLNHFLSLSLPTDVCLCIKYSVRPIEMFILSICFIILVSTLLFLMSF